MTTYGEWQTTGPVGTATIAGTNSVWYQANYTAHGDGATNTDANGLMRDATIGALTDPETVDTTTGNGFPPPGYRRALYVDTPPDDLDYANATWHSSYRWSASAPIAPGDYVTGNAYLPDDVWDNDAEEFVAPNVVGVEWADTPEPTGVVTCEVTLTSSDFYDFPLEGRVLVKASSDHTLGAPGFLLANQIDTEYTALPEVQITDAMIQAARTAGSAVHTFDVGGTLGGVNPFTGYYFAHTTVDKTHTLDAATPPDGPHQTDGVSPYRSTAFVPAQVRFSVQYAYRYRLIYDTEPVLRAYPRRDGRGMSSAKALWPPSKTVQDRRWLPFGGGYR